MTSLPLSICVVLYRAQEVSERFAVELRQSLAPFSDFEILFYDNSPTNELQSIAGEDCYIHDPSNPGFSYANNQLILMARHKSILLLNPDIFGLNPTFWTSLTPELLKDRVLFIKLLNADGSHQDCVGQPVGLSRALRRQPSYADVVSPTPIGAGIMAFMLTTRAVFAKVGLLDCDYPLYGEDMDWSHRANRHGIPVIYDPRFSLTHLGGASAGDRWSRSQSLIRKYRADGIFIHKHTRGAHALALKMLNSLKILQARLR